MSVYSLTWLLCGCCRRCTGRRSRPLWTCCWRSTSCHGWCSNQLWHHICLEKIMMEKVMTNKQMLLPILILKERYSLGCVQDNCKVLPDMRPSRQSGGPITIVCTKCALKQQEIAEIFCKLFSIQFCFALHGVWHMQANSEVFADCISRNLRNNLCPHD